MFILLLLLWCGTNESRKRKLVFGMYWWENFGLALNFILRCAVVSVCQKAFNQLPTYLFGCRFVIINCDYINLIELVLFRLTL